VTAPAASTEQRTIPFEYAFRSREADGRLAVPYIDMTGTPNRTTHATVIVSIEAAFTAVGIGYGVVPQPRPVRFGPDPKLTLSLSNVRLGDVLDGLARAVDEDPVKLGGRLGPETVAVLTRGFRLTPQFTSLALGTNQLASFDPSVVGRLFEEVPVSPEDVQFLYALYDEGSGRAFQSDPILNTAGLGIANGDRPFRAFTPPITFASRTTIRLDVTELTEIPAQLYVSLHGYKVLGSAGTPTGRARRLAARGR
jgi:hypothetical protein